MENARKNVVSNYAGAGWSALVSFVTIPFLLSMLGAESYGLIALFLSIKSIAAVFDFGLAMSSNREVAFRLGVKKNNVFDFIATVEVLSWLLGVCLSLVIWLLLKYFLNDWVSVHELSSNQLLMASLLFVFSLIGSWPALLYQNVLRGLNEHVRFNIALIIVSTLRNPGALLVIWLFSADVEAFMMWFLVVSVLEVILYRWLMRKRVKTISNGVVGKVDFNSLAGMKKFALGAGVSSIFATLIYQLDKILISMHMDLASVGYYSALLALVGVFGKLTTPVVRAVFPGLTAILSKGDTEAVACLYKHYAQMIASIILPMMVAIIAFAPQILALWLPAGADIAMLSNVLLMLSIAYVFYSLTNMPIIVHMVFKAVKLLIITRIVASIVLVPVLAFLINEFDLFGAAAGVLVCSITLHVILVFSVSRRLFPTYAIGELRMLLPPFLISAAIFLLLWQIYQVQSTGDNYWIISALFGVVASYAVFFRKQIKQITGRTV